jgi:alpha-glucoside transport system permease protein
MAVGTEDFAGRRSETRAQRMVGFITKTPLHIFLILIALFWMIPTIGLLATSFRPIEKISESGWWDIFGDPGQVTAKLYTDLLGDSGFVQSLLNTAYITVPTTVLLILIAALAAYAFAWIDFKGRDLIFLVVVALLVVPLQMALIPMSRLFGDVGIFGTIWAAILFHIAFGLPFAIFLLRNFFIGLPGELFEAARIDGASELQIFVRIVLPLGMPAIAALGIFQFLWTWNDLLVALVFTSGDSIPITVAIQERLRTFGGNLDVIAPGAFISMTVPLIVFFAFQRYFVQGLLAGSVK